MPFFENRERAVAAHSIWSAHRLSDIFRMFSKEWRVHITFDADIAPQLLFFVVIPSRSITHCFPVMEFSPICEVSLCCIFSFTCFHFHLYSSQCKNKICLL